MSQIKPQTWGGQMTPDEFRRYGRMVVDWLADYQERVESYPVLSPVAPGSIGAALPEAPPEKAVPFEEMLADVDRHVMPGITHWQSPSFFAFFPANVSGPSVLAELLTAGLGVQGMLWATSPACTEVETRMLDWLCQMLDLPARFRSAGSGGGVLQDSASSAVLCALLAARERSSGGVTNRQGGSGRMRVYASTQAHSSVEKAVGIAGLGRDNLRRVPVDASFAMRPDELERMIREDREAGWIPCLVCATVGTTSSHAMDPIASIGRVCASRGVWLHVDAAMAGAAAVCPEFRHYQAGLELADSYCFNPHKWLLTNFDCSALFVADRAALIGSLSILPDYLRNQASENGAVIDYRDWQIPLGRRFRALKLWWVIRYHGVTGLQTLIRNHVALAHEFATRVRRSPDLELVGEPPLNLVCFRHRGGDASSRGLLDRLNATGRLYLTHTVLDDRLTLRFCVGQAHTEARHVEAAWGQIAEMARSLSGNGGCESTGG